jgi:hypothetical protein
MARAAHGTISETDRVHNQWSGRLSAPVDSVEEGAQDLGWSPRRSEAFREDSETGTYRAPAPLPPRGNHPTGAGADRAVRARRGGRRRFPSHAASDDIARRFFHDGKWYLHYMPPLGDEEFVSSEDRPQAALQEDAG